MYFSAQSAGSGKNYVLFSPLYLRYLNRQLMRISLITAIVLTASIHLLSATEIKAQSAQEVRLSIEFKAETVVSALRKIEQTSPFRFVYRNNDLKGMMVPDKVLSGMSVMEAIEFIFKGTNFSYKQVDRKILIFKNSTKQISTAIQPTRISGIVTDEVGNTLPGVSIRLKGNNELSTATDQNGHFSIVLAGIKNNILIFSYIGYATKEILISDQTSLRITLSPASGSLDEVQVIGYGTTTRKLNTGAVSSISSKELSKQTVDNPLTALQGRIAGMQITQDNGLPGGGVRVQIRGQNSLGYVTGNIPLYVVDGVPFTFFNGQSPPSDATNASGLSGANGGMSPFSMINPEDIERIDVLKDADATAIYGSRGSNGVILITTKKGSQGRTSINANVYSGTSVVGYFMDMMNTQDYLAMRKAAFAYTGTTPTTANALDLTSWDQNAYTDWQKWAIGGTSHTTNATASVSGGSEHNTFLFSSTYRDQGTVFPGAFGTQTFSSRLNAGHRSTNNKFSIDLSVAYSYMNNSQPTSDLSSIYNLAPNFPIYKSDGTLNWSGLSSGVFENPVATLRRSYISKTNTLISSMNLGYKITTSLTFKANLGYTLTNVKQTSTNPASAQNLASTATLSAISAANTLRYANNDNGNYIIEPQLEYLRALGKGKLQFLVGSTFQRNKADGVTIRGTNFSNESLINSLGNAGTVAISGNNYFLYKYNAIFARTNYNWKDKYIVDATFRRDGSSRFGPNNRFGNFGAVGAAWIFSSEDFMKDVSFISFGKLRGSYGITGNDQIPNYQYADLYTTGFYPYLGTSNLIQYNVPNPDVKWESNKKLDFALELGFLDDRISLKTDYYRNRSSDQLISIALPGQSGFSSNIGNFPATVQNKGWEFELNTMNLKSGSFKWNTALNLTFNRNKLLSFPGLSTSSYATSLIVGQPIDIVQLYHYTGVNPATGAPTFQDYNGDNAYTVTADRIPMKVGTPYYGGLTNSFSYQNFTLDFTFQFNHRYGYKDGTLSTNFYPYGYSYTNQNVSILDRWMQNGDTNYFPSAGSNFRNDYFTLYGSDYNWGNTSYIKFKTLSLNYSIPKQLLRKAHISSASIYAQGQNLYTWAKQKYTYDPESLAAGAGTSLGSGRFLAFPQLRTIVFGINLSL